MHACLNLNSNCISTKYMKSRKKKKERKMRNEHWAHFLPSARGSSNSSPLPLPLFSSRLSATGSAHHCAQDHTHTHLLFPVPHSHWQVDPNRQARRLPQASDVNTASSPKLPGLATSASPQLSDKVVRSFCDPIITSPLSSLPLTSPPSTRSGKPTSPYRHG